MPGKDWETHKSNCRKLSIAELDRFYSLRMNLVRFMKQNCKAVFDQMVDCFEENDRGFGDLAVEVDLMPDKNGVIPALQDPPNFRVQFIEEYANGNEFPEFFDKDWDTDLQENWLQSLASKMTAEIEYKAVAGALVVHHAGRIYVDTKTLEQCFLPEDGITELEDIFDLRIGSDWCSPPVSCHQKN